MNDAIERAAKAAYTTMVLTFSDADWVAGLMAWEYQPEKLRANWRAAIRSAAAQLREPPEAQILAWETRGGSYRLRGRPDLRDIWRAMVDTLIADGAPLKVGDVVRRRGGRGGPKMTVRTPGDFAVLCTWFEDESLREKWIPEMDLEKVES